MKALDVRTLFRKRKDEGNKAQARLEEVEGELSPVAVAADETASAADWLICKLS